VLESNCLPPTSSHPNPHSHPLPPLNVSLQLIQSFVVSLHDFSSYHSSLLPRFETLERKTMALIELTKMSELHFSCVLHAQFSTIAIYDVTTWAFLIRRDEVGCSLGDKLLCLHPTHLLPTVICTGELWLKNWCNSFIICSGSVFLLFDTNLLLLRAGGTILPVLICWNEHELVTSMLALCLSSCRLLGVVILETAWPRLLN